MTTPHFPIYLDYGATNPCDPRVVDAIIPWLREHFGNPASRSHAWGWEAEAAVEKAREQVADLIGAAGLSSPSAITSQHLMVRNAQGQARPLSSVVDTLSPGQLLPEMASHAPLPSPFAEFWHDSRPESWGVQPA